MQFIYGFGLAVAIGHPINVLLTKPDRLGYNNASEAKPASKVGGFSLQKCLIMVRRNVT